MDIESKINKENFIGFGSNRIVFDIGDGMVAKLPYNDVGVECNKTEYEYYNKKKDIVAKVFSLENNIIIQEKLSDTIIVPYMHTINNTAKDYLKAQGIDFSDDLACEMLNTKVQVGKDKKGNLKFFDYEDAKLRQNYIKKPYRMTENDVDLFIEYIHNIGINNIKKGNTFEKNII